MSDPKPGLGIFVVLVSAFAGATYGAWFKVKITHKWRWENLWGICMLWGGVLFPWLFTFVTEWPLAKIFQFAGIDALWPFLAGIGFGIGNMLFGQGLVLVGMSMVYGIVLTESSAFGSVVPMLVFQFCQRKSKTAIYSYISLAVMIPGVIMVAYSGLRRDKEQRALAYAEGRSEASEGQESDVSDDGGRRMKKGILFCVCCGFFSTCINLGFTAGYAIVDGAAYYGVPTILQSNAVWAIILSACGAISVIQCSVLCTRKEGGWAAFTASGRKVFWINIAIGMAMGTGFYLGFIIYGWGATLMGDLGPTIGWPMSQIFNIIIANIFGFLTGEWKGSSKKTYFCLCCALTILFVSVILLGFGASFQVPCPSDVPPASSSSFFLGNGTFADGILA